MRTTPSSPGSGGTLSDRYGDPRRGRLLVIVVAAVLAVAFLVWLAWAAWFHGNPEVSSELTGYDVVSEHEVVADLSVVLEGDGPATCVLQAIAEDHSVVGEVAAEITASGTHEVSVRTERRATAVESKGCTTTDQTRPR